MLARLFAVMAAVLLVASVALGALLPPGTNLAQAMLDMNEGSVKAFQGMNPRWTWDWLCVPLLARPVWLIPAALGLICAGFAATFNLGQASSSRRKRS